jgi:hypothetical protein
MKSLIAYQSRISILNEFNIDGWNQKKNQFKKVKNKLAIKRMWIKFDMEKKLKGDENISKNQFKELSQ